MGGRASAREGNRSCSWRQGIKKNLEGRDGEEELERRRQQDVTPFFVSKLFVGLISSATSG